VVYADQVQPEASRVGPQSSEFPLRNARYWIRPVAIGALVTVVAVSSSHTSTEDAAILSVIMLVAAGRALWAATLGTVGGGATLTISDTQVAMPDVWARGTVRFARSTLRVRRLRSWLPWKQDTWQPRDRLVFEGPQGRRALFCASFERSEDVAIALAILRGEPAPDTESPAPEDQGGAEDEERLERELGKY